MSISGQFDKVYSDQESVDKCHNKARGAGVVRTSNHQHHHHHHHPNGKIIVLISSAMLFAASTLCLFDSLRELDSKTSECQIANTMGRVASALIVETAASFAGILSATLCFFTLMYPIVESLEGEDCYNVHSFGGSLNSVGLQQQSSRRTQTASRFIFSCHLTTTLSAFGALMTITTCSIRLLSIWTKEWTPEDDYGAPVDFLRLLYMLRQSLRLVAALIILACNVVLICIINKVMQGKIKSASIHVEKYEDDLEDFLRRFHHNDWKYGYPCKPVPILCSFLIITGGLAILGCVMGRLSIPRYIESENFEPDLRPSWTNFIELSTWGGLPSGLFALVTGVIAVAAVHCCAAPMWQIEDDTYSNTSQLMSHGCFHIFSICLCILTICSAGTSYYTEGLYLKDRAAILKIKNKANPDEDLKNVLIVKSALVLFSSLLHLIFAVPLLACLATDLQVRLHMKRANYLWKIIEKFKESASLSMKQFEQSVHQQTSTAMDSLPRVDDSHEESRSRMQSSRPAPNEMMMIPSASNTTSQWSGHQTGFRLPSAADALIDTTLNHTGGSQVMHKNNFCDYPPQSVNHNMLPNNVMGLPPYDSGVEQNGGLSHPAFLAGNIAPYTNDLPFFRPNESSTSPVTVRDKSKMANFKDDGSNVNQVVQSEVLMRKNKPKRTSDISVKMSSRSEMSSFYGPDSSTLNKYNMTSV